ncbi:aquaporin [Deinococcus sp. ZS9-10]|uniref:Aquaporin n=1 Tax=Deinococcus arenicola TaxID=2994950 RepID=A0ABU4DU89_9DEIO|nr:aquaporin [Deinococcus sp. ZS9-10]MDV6375943.1 aquaporin [Deinococcus sp. ZS9-10]
MTKKLIAEAIGTFALLFAGMLSIANDASLLGVAFAHGLAIAVMAMALGTVSGGQFNPAVSIGLSLTGHQKWSDSLAFIAAQFVGPFWALLLRRPGRTPWARLGMARRPWATASR